MEPTDYRITEIEHIDWYDGVVLGVVRTSWRPGIFLASLVACLLSEQRVYALVPLEDDVYVPLFGGRWFEDTAAITSALRSSLPRTLELVSTLSADYDVVVARTMVSAAEIEADLFGEIDTAMERDRRKWIDLLSK